MKRRLSKFAMILAIGSAIVGCSTTKPIKSLEPVLLSKPVTLDCILVETISSVKGLDLEKRELCEAIVSDLRDSALFKTVTDSKADIQTEGVKVEVQIEEIKEVTEEAREWVGGLAGSAKVEVKVLVSDLGSGKLIEKFQCQGVTGKTAYGGTTEEAIQRVAAQIRTALVKLNEQTSQ